MDEKMVKRVSLIVFIFGSLFLYLVLINYEPDLVDIDTVSSGRVKFYAVVNDVKVGEKYVKLDLIQEKKIEAILFTKKDVMLHKGDRVIVSGRYDDGLVVDSVVLRRVD